jgi:hypothetical protein
MASKRRIRRKQAKVCATKIGHQTKEYAITAMKHTRALNPVLQPYRCPNCQLWHLGKVPRKYRMRYFSGDE